MSDKEKVTKCKEWKENKKLIKKRLRREGKKEEEEERQAFVFVSSKKLRNSIFP